MRLDSNKGSEIATGTGIQQQLHRKLVMPKPFLSPDDIRFLGSGIPFPKPSLATFIAGIRQAFCASEAIACAKKKLVNPSEGAVRNTAPSIPKKSLQTSL